MLVDWGSQKTDVVPTFTLQWPAAREPTIIVENETRVTGNHPTKLYKKAYLKRYALHCSARSLEVKHEPMNIPWPRGYY